MGMGAFWLVVSGLALAAGLAARARIRARRDDDAALGDDEVRRIEEEGSVWLAEDEPLDLEAAEEAERRFWEEDWEEPEEW